MLLLLAQEGIMKVMKIHYVGTVYIKMFADPSGRY